MIATNIKRQLTFDPVSLRKIADAFDGLENVFEFYQLVSEYLPEERERLVKKNHTEAGREFVKIFSKKYFPITDPSNYRDDVGLLKTLTHRIQTTWYGLKTWEYDHVGRVKHARLLASVICVCPVDNANRLPIIDKFAQMTGGNIQVPSTGYQLSNVERILKDSPYPGLLVWCQWLFSKTGNIWLDVTGENPEWNKHNVEMMTADWKEYPKLKKLMDDCDAWLKEDFRARSIKILKYMKIHKPNSLYEVFNDGEN